VQFFILCLSCCWKCFEGWLLQRNGAVGFVIVFASTCRIGMIGVAEEKIEFSFVRVYKLDLLVLGGF